MIFAEIHASRLASQPALQGQEPIELTVVVPTFNERDNICPLAERLRVALSGISWQVIFVDDNSADGTAQVVKRLANDDPRVMCLHRIGRRGLAGAVLEGVMASAAPVVAVIDADLQHDETILPGMLGLIRSGEAELVVGSRYLTPEGLDTGLSPMRLAGSRVATWIARLVLRAEVSDPVSGFFMIRRDLVERVAPRLSSQGFKVLFDIIASQPEKLKIAEVPYAFAERQAGDSKLDGRVVIEYLGLILSKLTRNVVPPRALLFGIVGSTGLLVHFAALYLCRWLGLTFIISQTLAALTAMTSNFLINNQVTYRDRRLKGWRLFTGYLRFCALCGLGLVANVAIADLVHQVTPLWWLAGASGAIFGAIWNYVGTSLAVW
ncbi:MAG: glycosyltransferase family 2 protein [Caulobacteraceae bacterium]|nr:glycosyltransferase family 2 protein [Caulobacteraceae bacterium]